MAKYKQGYADRQDERYAMKKRNERYGMGGMGVMGHDSKPHKCDPFAAQKSDMGRLKREPMNDRGNPKQAWDYKY